MEMYESRDGTSPGQLQFPMINSKFFKSDYSLYKVHSVSNPYATAMA